MELIEALFGMFGNAITKGYLEIMCGRMPDDVRCAKRAGIIKKVLYSVASVLFLAFFVGLFLVFSELTNVGRVCMVASGGSILILFIIGRIMNFFAKTERVNENKNMLKISFTN